MNQAFSLADVLWSADPAAQRAIGLILGLALFVALAVYLPLIIRSLRLYSLERQLRSLIRADQGTPAIEHYQELFADSPIFESFEEFERRWETAQIGEVTSRAPIRLLDVLEDRPLLAFGPRRSLIPVLPGLFLAIGVFSALSGLIPSLSETDTLGMNEASRSAWVAGQIGISLRAAAWGFLCAIGASVTGRLIEGAFDARSHGLDAAVEYAFGSVSPGELAEITRRKQEETLQTLAHDLGNFNNELNDRIDRGLQRIEQSSARAASLVSQEQRGALNTVVQELSLSVRQGVEQHLGELHSALSRAVEHQNSVTSALAETFEQMVANAKQQDLIAHTLAESMRSVEDASKGLCGAASEMQPVVDKITTAHMALEKTAQHITESQLVIARTAEEMRTSLDTTRDALRHEMREEIRRLQEATASELGQQPRQTDTAAEVFEHRPIQNKQDRWTTPRSLQQSIGQETAADRNGPSAHYDTNGTPPAPVPQMPSSLPPAPSPRTPNDLGFRMGVPRAKGPDPYARFDSPENTEVGEAAPSVVGNEKTSGDDLKLSELLHTQKSYSPQPPVHKKSKKQARTQKSQAAPKGGE